MHRRFWGHTCATTYQLRPFPKDLFALQSAYIPDHWVYLENIILTSRRAAALPKQIKMKEFGTWSETHSDTVLCLFTWLVKSRKQFFCMDYAAPCITAHSHANARDICTCFEVAVWLYIKPDNEIIWFGDEMSKCSVGACRLTSIRRLVKPPALSKSDYLKYITQWKLPWQLQVSLWPSLSPFRFSLTLPHNTNLHCMSQLGALTEATRNPKNKQEG